jgi:precorrin-2 dehydrogenase/sirohydrochlorin ferrochelatase
MLRGFSVGDLAGAFLVFAATDNLEVQALVSREAEERSVLLNSVDTPLRCDFQVPARIRRGDLLITVSTGGASPALSKLIREQLEAQYGNEYAAVIELFARIREVVVPGPGTSIEHGEVFQKLMLSDIVECARKGDWNRVEGILRQILPAEVDTGKLVDLVVASARE